jgi:hypothetical protein
LGVMVIALYRFASKKLELPKKVKKLSGRTLRREGANDNQAMCWGGRWVLVVSAPRGAHLCQNACQSRPVQVTVPQKTQTRRSKLHSLEQSVRGSVQRKSIRHAPPPRPQCPPSLCRRSTRDRLLNVQLLDLKGVSENPHFGFRIGYKPLNVSGDARFLTDSQFGFFIVRGKPVLPENHSCHGANAVPHLAILCGLGLWVLRDHVPRSETSVPASTTSGIP